MEKTEVLVMFHQDIMLNHLFPESAVVSLHQPL
jgi:hypothetical protein